METWKIVLIAVGCVAVMAAVIVMAAIPGRRLRQVSQYLRQVLEDPEQQPEVPVAIQRIGGELSAVRNTLLARQEEAARQEKRQQELIAFLAHDLKTPLTSVLGYLQLLRDEPGLSEEQRVKYTGIALDKAHRLEELVGEFFDINTMELVLKKQDEVQISFLLEQLADEFYPLFAGKSLICRPEIEPHLVVLGDGDRLARVFDNVLRNAVNYSAAGAEVELTARREGELAVVRISDEGLEIPEGELSNIFDKFYRLDAARSSSTGGAGLGLAIAREIVELHGGTIRAESTGKKATFIISLPVAG